MDTKSKPHPIQPLEFDDHGVLRFKSNAIVKYLLDTRGLNMNDIALGGFSREDQEQFAQLIGYSHSGAYDLEYMSREVLYTAKILFKSETTEHMAKINALQAEIHELRTLRARILALVE